MIKKYSMLLFLLVLIIPLSAAPVLDDLDRVAISMEPIKLTDVVVIVSSTVTTADGVLRPTIPYKIRQLRRCDTLIYDSEVHGIANRCLIIMVVPIENEAELVARVAADPSLALVTPDKEAKELIVFPLLDAFKVRALNLILSEGK